MINARFKRGGRNAIPDLTLSHHLGIKPVHPASHLQPLKLRPHEA